MPSVPLWLDAVLLKQLCDEAGPPCLVARADARAVVAVEVFVEGNEVAPIGIGLKLLDVAEYRATLITVSQKDPRESCRDLASNFPKPQHLH